MLSASPDPQLSAPRQTSPPAPEEARSYRDYLQRIRESRPYWDLTRQLELSFSNKALSKQAPYQTTNPTFILELAPDGSTKHFSYEKLDELKLHLNRSFVRDGYGYTNMSAQGRRVMLVTDLQLNILEVLGDIYGMDIGFFADHSLADEHVSYTSKTTRGVHLHVLEEKKPPSQRFQFEYRELGRNTKDYLSTRNVCRVFKKSGPFGWDAIFQRRFSRFTHNPPDGGLITGERVFFESWTLCGPFARGVSRLDLPSFVNFKSGENAAFDRSLGIYQQYGLLGNFDRGSHFQDELILFFKSPDFRATRAFESSSYILAHILKLTLVMWRHLITRIQHSFLDILENRIAPDDDHEPFGEGLSSVSAELSKCAHLVQKKTIPTIRALIRDLKGEEELAGVLEEYVVLCEEIQYVATRAEKAHSIVLTKLTIIESKKAIEHSIKGIELAKRFGNLTYLAFIFVPLSFVASFMGMNGLEVSDDFSAQTKRVIWVFFTTSLPLVLITVFLAAVPYRILSVTKRVLYLFRRRFGIGWVSEGGPLKEYHPVKGDTWEGYHQWLCSLGWERNGLSNSKILFAVINNGNYQETQMTVGLLAGTWLHLGHAWRNVK